MRSIHDLTSRSTYTVWVLWCVVVLASIVSPWIHPSSSRYAVVVHSESAALAWDVCSGGGVAPAVAVLSAHDVAHRTAQHMAHDDTHQVDSVPDHSVHGVDCALCLSLAVSTHHASSSPPYAMPRAELRIRDTGQTGAYPYASAPLPARGPPQRG